MRIKRIVIKNFRSIQSLEFSPANICALIGENNAGKTNILSALNFLLGETWPTKHRLEPSDYFNKITDEPIEIGVEYYPNPLDIQCVWCKMPWDEKAETKMKYFRNRSFYNLSAEVRDHCALVYLDANRDLAYHLGHSSWRLFGRIIRRLDDFFREEEPEERMEELEKTYQDAQSLLRTKLYTEFEETTKKAFRDQLRRTGHKIELEFQTFDPLNYYRALQPVLIEDEDEDEERKNPLEAGQGMRNLILLALFRAYAKVFKGDAIIAVEEPEIFLHPHAQRSLFGLFRDLADQGNQILYSTHSGNFVDIEHFDEICLVEKTPEGTKVKQVDMDGFLKRRQELHPDTDMTEFSIRERYRNICSLEHNEAFFSKKIVLVEGETEEYALPIFARGLSYDFDSNGVSVVNAHGKGNLDQLWHLYTAFGISIYLIFDNDRGGKESDLALNETLLRMLGMPEERVPVQVVESDYAIFEGNYEKMLATDLGPEKYNNLVNEAKDALGAKAGKGIVARYIAQRLVAERIVPSFIVEIIEHIIDGNIYSLQS